MTNNKMTLRDEIAEVIGSAYPGGYTCAAFENEAADKVIARIIKHIQSDEVVEEVDDMLYAITDKYWQDGGSRITKDLAITMKEE